MKRLYLKYIGICAVFATSLGISGYMFAQKKDKPLSIRDKSLSELLDWVENPNAPNLCGGYYKITPINFPQNLSSNKTLIHSKDATYYADKPSVLHHVTVLQPERKLTADEAYSELKKNQNWQANDIHLKGNVHLHEAGILAVADSGTINIKNNTASLKTLAYRATVADNSSQSYSSTEDFVNANKVNNVFQNSDAEYPSTFQARGIAKDAEQTKPKILTLHQATYTTCSPDSTAWHLKATRITLDKNTGDGTAVNALLYIHDVPIFYFPYFGFPIDNKRRSGFLYPTAGFGNKNGFQLSTPYYINIAPNFDDLITPNIYSKRGVKLDNLFRYLTWRRMGQFYFSILPGDKVFSSFKKDAVSNSEFNTQPGFQRLEQDSSNRINLNWQDQNIINNNWTNIFDVNYVSDDYYFQDFGDNLNTLQQNQLLQLAGTNYASKHWNASGFIQNYQTLHPVNDTSSIPDQYARFPDILFSADYPEKYLEYNLNGEFVNFRWPIITENYQPNLPNITGQRYNIAPSLALPIYHASYHFVPRVEYDATAYQLNNQIPGQNKEFDRGVPIYDIDTGLYFQRQVKLFGADFYQTLEPRLYYVYIPYRDQDALPLFDASTQTFTYDSLFENNRFTSIDRIGDTNHLSYSLSTEFIDKTSGEGRLRASIGQIMYFENRQVSIPGDTNNTLSTSSRLSPIVAELSATLYQHWYASYDAAWDTTNKNLNNSTLSLIYEQNHQNTFSISYNFLKDGDPLPNDSDPSSARNNLNQLALSESWKFNHRWGVYSSIRFNLSHHYTQNYVYGLEYDSCCWAIRLVTTRSFVGLNTNNRPNYNNGVALQIALNGLGNIGNEDTTSPLESNIPGFIDEFGKSRVAGA